ncbi:putative eukaryotic aspartyl protease [Podospora fimiseda]|uniref:Eukaryotic aspartyl protease n=1 Tax=Podospora fimiseda TaxID=252190 RepID=A0AAN7BGA6_9PEZI|nr:putative eukaryotic aspartyl protease [Podospora fimiseda]
MKSILLALSLAVTPSAAASLHHDLPTPNYIPMRRHESKTPSTLLHKRSVTRPANLTNVHDVYYIIDITVGNQTIPVSIDTGSSDTWLVQEPYECVSYFFPYPGAKPDCGLGTGFVGPLSGGNITTHWFGRAYMDGTFVTGFFGYEDVTIGGLTAKHQQVALVNYTFWQGDGRTSGLLGLAYPYMTGLDGPEEGQPAYDPVFTTMWKDKLIDPVFSIALSRTNSEAEEQEKESYLALGGLPPVTVDEKTWAKSEIRGIDAIPEWGFETKEKGLYIIEPEGWVIDGKKNETETKTRFPVLIDVGATLSILPKSIVNPLYAAFDPPAIYISGTGLFFAPCNATVPKFGVKIGGRTFSFAPEDLLRQTVRDRSGEYCRVGVTDVSSGPYVLGVSWLTSVVAVFDVFNSEMRFASRIEY